MEFTGLVSVGTPPASGSRSAPLPSAVCSGPHPGPRCTLGSGPVRVLRSRRRTRGTRGPSVQGRHRSHPDWAARQRPLGARFRKHRLVREFSDRVLAPAPRLSEVRQSPVGKPQACRQGQHFRQPGGLGPHHAAASTGQFLRRSYTSPVRHSRSSTTESFRATATAARFFAFFPPRAISCIPQRLRSQSGPNGPRM